MRHHTTGRGRRFLLHRRQGHGQGLDNRSPSTGGLLVSSQDCLLTQSRLTDSRIGCAGRRGGEGTRGPSARHGAGVVIPCSVAAPHGTEERSFQAGCQQTCGPAYIDLSPPADGEDPWSRSLAMKESLGRARCYGTMYDEDA